jgi:hypothetical protein
MCCKKNYGGYSYLVNEAAEYTDDLDVLAVWAGEYIGEGLIRRRIRG